MADVTAGGGSHRYGKYFKFIIYLIIAILLNVAGLTLFFRIDLTENEYFDEDPRLTTNAEAMALGRTPYSLVYNQLFNDANGPWLAMIQQAVFDGQIDEAIEFGQEGFAEIMAEE